jgi:hypothetical protein
MNLGIWEGMLSNDIKAQFPQELEVRTRNPLHTHAPNGEAPHDVADRVLLAVNEITSKYRAIPSPILKLHFLTAIYGGFRRPYTPAYRGFLNTHEFWRRY